MRDKTIAVDVEPEVKEAFKDFLLSNSLNQRRFFSMLVKSIVNAAKESQNHPEFMTLRDAAALKGVLTYENLQKKPWLQPCCGTRWVKIGGHRCWTRAQIEQWLKITDATLERYAAELDVDISKHFANGRAI